MTRKTPALLAASHRRCTTAVRSWMYDAFRVAVTIAVAALAAIPCGAEGAPPPPDLRLEWKSASPIEGRSGQVVLVPYRLRNIGGAHAFASILRVHTTLGPYDAAERIQPGPKAGQTIDRAINLALAVGIREVCVEVTLQTLAADERGDPNLKDNRVCAPVKVTASEK